MLRVLKRYRLNFHWTERDRAAVVPGSVASFSSYPGVIYSGDDFNVVSSTGLVVIETTIGNSNGDLWSLVRPTGQVLEGIRATVANRLATYCTAFEKKKKVANLFAWYVSIKLLFSQEWKPVDQDLLQEEQRHVQQPVDGGGLQALQEGEAGQEGDAVGAGAAAG